MGKLLVHSGDLVLGSKIRAAADAMGLEYLPLKTDQQITELCRDENLSAVIFDLNSTKVDIFAILSKAVENGLVSKAICFYSHVDRELAEKARSLGVQNVYKRSEFFNDLPSCILPGSLS